MGDLHIYQVEGMEEFLPHTEYHGAKGYIQSFCNGLSSVFFPKAESKYFDNKQTQLCLEIMNNARNMRLLENQKSLIIRKMNWYVNKIVAMLVSENYQFDCYCYYLDISIYCDPKTTEFRPKGYESSDVKFRCNDDVHKISFGEPCFLNHIAEQNYLKRDYSNKLRSYSYNLAELYGKYFEDNLYDKNGNLHIFLNPCVNGNKSFGKGFIEW